MHPNFFLNFQKNEKDEKDRVLWRGDVIEHIKKMEDTEWDKVGDQVKLAMIATGRISSQLKATGMDQGCT